MIEILLLVFLGKKLAAMVERKGREAYNFVYLFVVLWFVGEVAGFVVGQFVFSSDDPMENLRSATKINLASYLLALVGAGVGGTLGYAVARFAAPASEEDASASEIDNQPS